MIQIAYKREKCIGCNYCIELAPDRWRMNKKDGRSVLLGSRNKKGLYTVEVNDLEILVLANLPLTLLNIFLIT